MTLHRRGMLLVAAAAAALLTSAASADIKAGIDAWAGGRYDAAVKEWRPLAEKGDADAQYNMGQAYKLGRGVPSDLKLAQTWYEKAAQQGHQPAQANLGLILFQNGERAAAMPWIKKAAEYGDARAQYVLGTTLFNGDLVGKDWPRAYALMLRASAQGLAPATTTLTEMNGYIPLADREKGTALAKQMALSAAVTTAAEGTPVKVTSPGDKISVASASSSITAAQLPPATIKSNAPKPTVKTAVEAPKPPVAPKPAPAAVKPAASLATAGGKWRVQLGAYGSPAGARGQWAAISKKIGALSGLSPAYEAAGTFTRLRAGPLANRAAADRLCAAAKAAGQACFPIAP